VPEAALVIAQERTDAVTPPMYEASNPIAAIFESQRQILLLDDGAAWQAGRVKAAASVLINCSRAGGDAPAHDEIQAALALSLTSQNNSALLGWLDTRLGPLPSPSPSELNSLQPEIDFAVTTSKSALSSELTSQDAPVVVLPPVTSAEEGLISSRNMDDVGAKMTQRRPEENASKSLKVEQSKIDLLMNLIGEMVVSKNALPYLAQRAEEQFGVRELAREIKAQYAVINRIAEEMQSAIMQVRMMPVSNVFQRFPRLVRDISRKLEKQVQLVLEGEDTEADKNIIESLADPLMHIVRNSLDHGLELPEVRRAAGKPAMGKLTIRAAQEGDQVMIEIIDDGKGINPAIIKRKAFEKGVIDALALERISDRDAINLVFAPGFSTAEVVSDLSGRGVGMDVVRTAVEKVNGSIMLESVVGEGTHIRICLPLSMAVTKVMIIESDKQIFGVPMEQVVETVRVPCSSVRRIKHIQTIVRRGAIVPLKSLNTLLGIAADSQANADSEIAVLVVRVGTGSLGLIVDDFHETADVIQKPLSGVLAGLQAYSGSALMGNGSVLMVLNVKELV
jgi:two-component system chemotaxis sensor kinase CheA